MTTVQADPPLIRHLEGHLGVIAWAARDPETGVQVVRFDDQPVPGAVTFCTLGLSDHVLRGSAGRIFRMELLGCSYVRFDVDRLASNLLQIASEMLQNHRPLLRGEVIGPRGPVADGSTLEGYYCCSPVYFPEGFAELRATVPATAMVWLVPISPQEAHYVLHRGWPSRRSSKSTTPTCST